MTQSLLVHLLLGSISALGYRASFLSEKEARYVKRTSGVGVRQLRFYREQGSMYDDAFI